MENHREPRIIIAVQHGQRLPPARTTCKTLIALAAFCGLLSFPLLWFLPDASRSSLPNEVSRLRGASSYSLPSDVPRLPGASSSSDLPYKIDFSEPGEFDREIMLFPDKFEQEYESMEKSLQVYVYPPEEEFQSCNRTTEVEGKYYASELQFYRNILDSDFVTEDPEEAILFFFPIGCSRRLPTFDDCETDASVVAYLENSTMNNHPYWHQTVGSNHFWITCKDIDKTNSGSFMDLTNLLRSSVRVFSWHGSLYASKKDVALPEIALSFEFPAAVNRRTRLLYQLPHQLINTRDKMVAGRENGLEYRENLYNSKYCLCSVSGGPRYFRAIIADVILHGCVPVILSDGYRLPFHDLIDWSKFAVLIETKDLLYLNETLEYITEERYNALRKNTIKAQKHFQWNSPPVRFDAFHMTMYELWRRWTVMR